MACYNPLNGWLARSCNPKTGKRPIVFNLSQGYKDKPVKLPCGQCIGCKLDKSRHWATRCVHEAQMHEENSFLTLTYNDDNLPQHGSLEKKHVVDFMKRLRDSISPKKIRSFGCMEYGERLKRPHYHILIFGHTFDDQVLLKEYRGHRYYISEKLDKLWKKGYCVIGHVNFETAAYVSRYVTKKLTGPQAEDHYSIVDEYGEIIQLEPEQSIAVSRRPGIGAPWLAKHMTDVYPSDEVIIRGKKLRPPKFYDKKFELENPEIYKKLVSKRTIRAKNNPDNSPERLTVKEVSQLIKASHLLRGYENGT